jgi:heat shock protein HtpX
MESVAPPAAISHDWARTKRLDLKVPPEQMAPLLDYLIGILEKNKYLSNLSKSTTNGVATLQYRLIGNDGKLLDIAIKIQPDCIYVYYAPFPPKSISDKDYQGLDLELETIIRSYFMDQSKASLFLVFSPKMKIIPNKKENPIKKALGSIVLGNFIWFFIVILFIGVLLFNYIGNYTPLVLVAIQLVFVVLAGSFVKFRGEFEITEDNPSVFIAELRMKRQEFDQVIKSCLPKIADVKKKIYDSTLGQGKDLDQGTIVSTLNSFGAVCTPEFVRIKSANIFQLVKELGEKFGIVKPSTTLLNVLAPNAAATGISPKKATVLVTSGLIATMDEEEIKTVLAHEFSHVRARDPLKLMVIASALYLSWAYIIGPLLPPNFLLAIIIFFFYYTLLFFVAKFFEARADLDAAVVTQEPRILAASLRKLGLYKYQSHVFERISAGEWVNWDTHPPLYYRIRTLDNFDTSRTHRTQLEAIKGCVRGFIDSLHGK